MRIGAVSAIAALSVIGLIVPALAQSSGDPAKGRTVFARCAACHAVTPGTKRLGPSLAGIVGRKAGTVAGYTYSPAMSGSKVVWNARALDSFLARPASATVPGTKMSFTGISNPADRANLIAYLSSPNAAR